MDKWKRFIIVCVAMTVILGISLCIWLYHSYFVSKSYVEGRIVVVLKDTRHLSQFWQIVKSGADTAAAEFHVNVSYKGGLSETDVQGQVNALKEAAAEKPDAIVLAATDYEQIALPAEAVTRKGIRIILIDSGINSEKYDSLIATDNSVAGKQAGEQLDLYLDRQTEVAVINYVKGSETAVKREQGVLKGLQQANPGRKVHVYYCDDDPDKAFRIVTDLLRMNKNVKGIIGLNETSTSGAARAIDEMGMNGSVKLVGFDNSDEEITYLEKGTIQSIIVQRPFKIGYLGIKTATDAINDQPVPKLIDTGLEVITKDNMNNYNIQQILFPFMNF